MKITYLANEGVLIESTDARILVDVLFRDSLDDWDARSIARFLRENPAARFASTTQATAMLPFEVRARYSPCGLTTAVRVSNYRITFHLGDATQRT